MAAFNEASVVRRRGRFAEKPQQEPEIRFERLAERGIAERQAANREIADNATAALERGEIPAGGYDSVGCSASGRLTYRLDGQLHNTAGPAVVRANGDLEFYIDGRRDNPHGPAIVNRKGTQLIWYYRGLPVDPPDTMHQLIDLVDGVEAGVWDADYARQAGGAMLDFKRDGHGAEEYDAFRVEHLARLAAEDAVE